VLFFDGEPLKQQTASVRPYSPAGSARFEKAEVLLRPDADRVRTFLVIAATLASVLATMVAARALL